MAKRRSNYTRHPAPKFDPPPAFRGLWENVKAHPGAWVWTWALNSRPLDSLNLPREPKGGSAGRRCDRCGKAVSPKAWLLVGVTAYPGTVVAVCTPCLKALCAVPRPAPKAKDGAS